MLGSQPLEPERPSADARREAVSLVDQAQLEGTPFRLPIAVFRIRANLSSPLCLDVRAGASLATTLRGAYDAALVRAGCRRPLGSPPCHDDDRSPRGVTCAVPLACPVAALYKPRSMTQRRDHPSPIDLRIEQTAATQLAGRVTLWGRRALAARGLIFDALTSMGRRGLWDGSQAVRFDAIVEPVFEGTLGAWVLGQQRHAAGHGRVLVELSSPCHGAPRPFGPLAGLTAHDLVQWDLEDSGASATLGKRGCDDLAEGARACAESAFERVTIVASRLDVEDRGQRYSRGNRHRFRIEGVSGFIELRGDLTAAAPWLMLMALRGVGQKRAFGLGSLRLWWPSPEGQSSIP
jgi:hypothetical protein